MHDATRGQHDEIAEWLDDVSYDVLESARKD